MLIRYSHTLEGRRRENLNGVNPRLENNLAGVSDTMFSNSLERESGSNLNLDQYWDFFGNPQRQFQEERGKDSLGSEGRRPMIRNRSREGTPAPVIDQMSRWSHYGRGSHVDDREVTWEEGEVEVRPGGRKVIRNNLRGGISATTPKSVEPVWSVQPSRRRRLPQPGDQEVVRGELRVEDRAGQVVTTQAGVGLVTGGHKAPLYNRINAVLSRTRGKNGLAPRTKVIMNRFREAEKLEQLEEVMAVTRAPSKLVTWVPKIKQRPLWAGGESWSMI